MKRRELRKIAVQTLYQVALAGTDWKTALAHTLDGKSSDPYLEKALEGVLTHCAEIDEQIQKALTNWNLERLSKVDHAILRLAVYELLFDGETPSAVVINEAVELGKLFGSEKNGKFINGVLAAIVRQRSNDE